MRKWMAAILFLINLLGFQALADVAASKANGYAVLSPQAGISASKANGYAVVGPLPGISASKAIAYAVVGPPATSQQPSVFIFTKLDIQKEHEKEFWLWESSNEFPLLGALNLDFLHLIK